MTSINGAGKMYVIAAQARGKLQTYVLSTEGRRRKGVVDGDPASLGGCSASNLV
ncbi:MAG: hypothetical protein QXR84_04820 [Candidatus Bathyarchaeia archaeon]|nr:hypothetical protein [Candidatus Bathyarchaeota archaeon]